MLDLLIILSFVAYAVYSGFKSKSDAGKNLKEYFLAGRTLKGWKSGISMAATQFAADTPLLVTGLIATGGIFLIWRLWIYGIAFLVMAYIFSTKWRRSGVITDAELAEVRYSGKGVTTLRVLKAVYYGTVINCTIMAMVLVAAMRIAEAFLFWDQWLPEGIYVSIYNFISWIGVPIGVSTAGVDPYIQTTNNLISIFVILAFTTLYSTTGGLRSVVATDIVQFGFAMVGTLFFAGYILYHAGGFKQIVYKIESLYGSEKSAEMLSFSPGIGEALLPFLMIIGLQWLFQMNSDGTGYLAQRMIACRTEKDAKIAALTFTWVQILLRSLIWLVIAVGLLVIYPFELSDIGTDGFTASRELTFVKGINDLLPIGIKGIMLTGLLGALASTIDTHLNWGASYWSNDIYGDLISKKLRKREAKSSELVWVARFSNILILFIALIIMFNLGSIQQAWFISLLFGAGTGSVLVLRWLWEKVNLYSEIAAIGISLLIAPILLIFVDEEWLKLLLMSGISTTVVIIVSYLTPPTDDQKLNEFYLKIKPQGFWKNTAARIGHSQNIPLIKLKKSIVQIIINSLSLFSLLVGFGKLMFRPTNEGILFPLLLIVIGLALIPLWWNQLKESESEDTKDGIVENNS